MATDARTEIFNRIHAAVGTSTSQAVADEWLAIPRAYRRSSPPSRADLVDQLIDRLHDYDAQVTETTRAELAAVIGDRLQKQGLPRMVVPQGFPAEWLAEGGNFVVDDGLSTLALDGFGGVLTLATLAMAETGSIVLQGVAGQGRRAASLVPDYHLCLVDVGTVVGSVPEAMERLHRTSTLPTTFISGPSATADIEMTRIKGVHGPRFLDVVLYT